MATARNSRVLRTIPLLITICLVSFPAYAKYSGGTGVPNDPYQIATAADLIALGETPEDYDRHFILTADIDLDPRLPGRKVFDRAVIAPDTNPNDQYSQFQGTSFTGVLDGNGHTISHMTVQGKGYLGLFGQVAWGTEVKNIGVVKVNITGDYYVGGLVGLNGGALTHCYSTGAAVGGSCGGLVGYNSGTVTQCHSTGKVSGTGWGVGGLVGENDGDVSRCYSTGSVNGGSEVGGLVGYNDRFINHCYSTGSVRGNSYVGGLVGFNTGFGSITTSYSTGQVSGTYSVGGLVGSSWGGVSNCFWDTQTSSQTTSAGGTGKTTAEMQDPNTFMAAGWDFVGQPDGLADSWAIPEGGGYPILWWQLPRLQGLPRFSGGAGEPNDPYRILTAAELSSIGQNPRLMTCHFKLMADIDLTGFRFYPIGGADYSYAGVFDGNLHTISHLTLTGEDDVGLFGILGFGAEVKDLGVVDVNVTSSGRRVGGLVGWSDGTVTRCYSTGAVSGNSSIGGLVGYNGQFSLVTQCYSTGVVTGSAWGAGGLVGANSGTITMSSSTSTVSGDDTVGGLVGMFWNGVLTHCYSMGAVSGNECVGGLVGDNWGTVTRCYSTGTVSGNDGVGGLVGNTYHVTAFSFWDMETSGQAESDGGTGLTTAEMQTASTFLIWGTCENEVIWTIDAGNDYPRLCWENQPGEAIWSPKLSDLLLGTGGQDDPFLIYTPEELNMVGLFPCEWDKHFRLMADIDLSGFDGKDGRPPFNSIGSVELRGHEGGGVSSVGIPFTGVFDGAGNTISHLTVRNQGCGGLFGALGFGGEVKNMGMIDVNIASPSNHAGGLAGINWYGTVTMCYSTGVVSGANGVGGLVGLNWGALTHCYSTAAVSGGSSVGGLVGGNSASISTSYSTGVVSGNSSVGGLVGYNEGDVAQCYSVAVVSGNWGVGGLVGTNRGAVTQCYSTGEVSGADRIGGLVGENCSRYIMSPEGTVAQCYSTAAVSGTGDTVGGLVGSNGSNVTDCFRHIQTSGHATSDAGTGKTTAQMQTASTFLDAGWDFVGETANGTEDIWWILEGKDYPRLRWELIPGK